MAFWAVLGLSAWATTVTLAGLVLPIPAGWQSRPSENASRLAEWQADGGVTIAALFFGSAHPEPPEKTLARWASTMTTPQGTPVPGRISTSLEGDAKMPVTASEIDLYGTYLDPRGGPAHGLPVSPRPGQGLLGVVLDYPGGPLYLCVTGPEAAVRAQENAFSHLIDGLYRKETP